jgi:hypothetical protein
VDPTTAVEGAGLGPWIVGGDSKAENGFSGVNCDFIRPLTAWDRKLYQEGKNQGEHASGKTGVASKYDAITNEIYQQFRLQALHHRLPPRERRQHGVEWRPRPSST